MDLIFFILSLFYAAGILFLAFEFQKIPAWERKGKLEGNIQLPAIAVIVCFRNELDNLPNLFSSLSNQSLSNEHYHVFLVNDNSDDGSREMAGNLVDSNKGFTLFDLPATDGESPKKRAIELVAQNSNSSHYLFTDADCVPNTGWIESYFHLVQKSDPLLVGGLVKKGGIGLRGIWEQMEGLILGGITALGLSNKMSIMVNGGNMLVKSEIMDRDPFVENKEVFSGDDMTLLNSAHEWNSKRIEFNTHPSGVVFTKEDPGFMRFWNQKIRWAGKWRFDKNPFQITVIGFLILFYVYSIVEVLRFFSFQADQMIILNSLLVKLFADLILCLSFSNGLRYGFSIFGFLLYEMFFGFYFLFFGASSRFLPYSWKGRKVNDHG